MRLPWPSAGQGAVAVPSVGVAAGSPGQKPVPVASLTKLMTAYVVLHDHPLTGASTGPDVPVTEADIADYDADTNNDDSNALVAPGEVITERQLLNGMLVHSADNYADMLASWDAGSIASLRGEDELRRGAARHEPDPLRRRQRHCAGVAVDGQ